MTAPTLPGELPDELNSRVAEHLNNFCENVSSDQAIWLHKQLAGQQFSNCLYRVWGGSEFVALNCLRNPEIFQQLVQSGDLARSYHETDLAIRCQAALDNIDSSSSERENSLHSTLRKFRRYEIMRIIWRDLSRTADLAETTRDMTHLADAVLHRTLDKLQRWSSEKWGTPIGGQSGVGQTMFILGMGKLGAEELNVSSDIDLIFTYPEAGETRGEGSPLSNQEFFIRVAQKLIQALDNQTEDGQVFRIDMRLRPYGGSGALVLSFDALEEYYQTQGRDWERYAMIKSRVINWDQNSSPRLMQMLRAFTYRRYTDFSVIQSLRDMKRMINHEVQRLGRKDNIKLGHGGIREIEFIAQAIQLIRGGRDSNFQKRPIKDILLLLNEGNILPPGGGENLWQAYIFLRNLEHVLQSWRDRQTQELPGDEPSRLRVAVMMGFHNWQAFREVLDQHRKIVKDLFDGLIAEPSTDIDAGASDLGALRIWHRLSRSDMQQELARLGYDDAAQAADCLRSLGDSHAVSAMASDTRARLDSLMPKLIDACADYKNSAQALVRVLALVESVARRSTYLVLLIENVFALRQLVTLCAASPWISQSLSRHPVLLDELLDARTLYASSDKAHMRDELRQHLLRIPEADLEAQMDALRYFRLAQGLRVAAREIMGQLPLMEVSDSLTWLAEAILEEVLILAWQSLTTKHGLPGGVDGDSPDFLIVGYGKLGGIELGHGSDLDLVFLYSADGNLMTTGKNSISNESFFTRLGQRIIHFLGTATAAGILYEVDMRLRPSGNAGLLVSSFDAFSKYQVSGAWTWEHQALVRARGVAGDAQLAQKFTQMRSEILGQERDIEILKRDVVAMRNKMTENLGLKASEREIGKFDLKQDPGGIVDIEFMVQFAVLAQAHRFSGLARWSDNIRILDALSEYGIVSEEENRRLTAAYIAYRSAGHRLQLQQEQNIVAAEEYADHRSSVIAVWQRLFGDVLVSNEEEINVV